VNLLGWLILAVIVVIIANGRRRCRLIRAGKRPRI
jgi:hypothetical protein